MVRQIIIFLMISCWCALILADSYLRGFRTESSALIHEHANILLNNEM